MPEPAQTATPETRRMAIKALEQHIIDVGQGRVRLPLKPDELDEYLALEYLRLAKMRAMGLRV
jgi:hypothetical protein